MEMNEDGAGEKDIVFIVGVWILRLILQNLF